MAFGLTATQVAGIGVGANLLGGILGSNAAADAQRDAANQATQTELQMYNQNREDSKPYREAGYTALNQLGSLTKAGGEFNRDFSMADYAADPGYAFRFSEGQRALENSAAARGGLLNGGTLKDLTNYGQGAASQEYMNAYNRFNTDRTARFNRLASLAGLGQTANNTLSNQGTQVANQIGENQIGAGNSNASAYVGTANAVNSAIGNLQSLYYLRPPAQPSQGANPYGGGSVPGGYNVDGNTYNNPSAYVYGG